jgi:hypothetical protein
MLLIFLELGILLVKFVHKVIDGLRLLIHVLKDVAHVCFIILLVKNRLSLERACVQLGLQLD